MFLSRLSIKFQLFIIVSIIAFPAICIIITSGLHQRKEAIHDAQIETQKLANAIVSVKNLVASTHQLFIALSQLPDGKTGKPSCQADDRLDTIFKRVDDLMYVAKNNGKIIHYVNGSNFACLGE